MGSGLGVITDFDIRTELLSRGITIAVPGVTTPVAPVTPVTPVVTLPPPEAPVQPITVSPGQPPDYYEPYIPYYPPAFVSPAEVEEEEGVLPARGRAEAGGIDRGVIILLGIGAISLVALSKRKNGLSSFEESKLQRRKPRRRAPARGNYEEVLI